jgi:hypothetical protein
MTFKYKQSIANSIIHVLSKKKADEKIWKAELWRRVDKLIHPSDRNDHTKPKLNTTHFSSALQALIQYRLVIKQKSKIKQGTLEQIKYIYSLSDLGLFFYKRKYEIKDIEKFVKISQLLLVVALFGSSALEERKTGEKPQAGDKVVPQEIFLNFDKNKRIKAKYKYGTRKEGLSKKDILEKRHYLTQSNLLRLNLTNREVDDYFNFLLGKKILKVYSYEGGEERYQLYDKNLEEFMNEVWVSLFSLLLMRIKTKLHYLVRKIDNDEKKWWITHLGKRNTILMNNDWFEKGKDIRKNKKSNNYLYLERKCKVNVEQFNNLIIKKYDELFANYKNIFELLPDMKNIIISLVCPKEMIDYIREENTNLIRNK